MKLSDISKYVNEKVSSSDISLSEYVTTDSLLQNKSGRVFATNLPPSPCSLTKFETGDVLIANIRPYLKKIWLANECGACSNDVLCLRAKDGHSSAFLYAVLMQDAFYDYVMKGAKGSKMPRGDKDQIMDFKVSASLNEAEIGNFVTNICQAIDNLTAINRNLEHVARQLYDYWFVQFDFPNDEGKPYKSSGGEMVWNERLKRLIPNTWRCGSLVDIAEYTNGLACQRFRPSNDNERLPVIKIREMRDGFTNDTEWVTSNIPDNVKVYNGDVLFSWSASLEVVLWAYGNGGLNQHLFKVTSKNGFPKTFYYFALKDYVEVFKAIAEARKTTMGHITREHLEQSTIAVPLDLSILNDFDLRVTPIFENIVNNQVEIIRLLRLRDELLPMLLNGQVNCDLSH